MGNALGIERRVFPGRPDPDARRKIVEKYGRDVEIRDTHVSWTSPENDGRPPLHVVCFHGNMEDVASTMGGWLKRTGATRLTAVEYPGYGWRVDETPTQRQVEDDAKDIASTIVEGERTIICGRSIGTYPALVLVDALPKSKKCDGVVLVSPPLSAVSTVISPGVVQRALWFVDIAKNSVPAATIDPAIRVLVAHGTEDGVVPIENARALVDILARTKDGGERDVRFLEVEGAKHNDVLTNDTFRHRLKTFCLVVE